MLACAELFYHRQRSRHCTQREIRAHLAFASKHRTNPEAKFLRRCGFGDLAQRAERFAHAGLAFLHAHDQHTQLWKARWQAPPIAYEIVCNGCLTALTHSALGQATTSVSYDLDGRVTRMQDANGPCADFAYSPRDWLTHHTVRAGEIGTREAGDALTHMVYDAVGNITQVTQPDGDYLVYTYDRRAA